MAYSQIGEWSPIPFDDRLPPSPFSYRKHDLYGNGPNPTWMTLNSFGAPLGRTIMSMAAPFTLELSVYTCVANLSLERQTG